MCDIFMPLPMRDIFSLGGHSLVLNLWPPKVIFQIKYLTVFKDFIIGECY